VRATPGFTLLEVLVALAILGLAIVTLIQLTSQGLRLLKLSGDHQEAALLAERLIRESGPLVEGIEAGRERGLVWERRVREIAVPGALNPPSGPVAHLLKLTVTVRWGLGRTLEFATLRVAGSRQP
jgi:general secretion pathway protein I